MKRKKMDRISGDEKKFSDMFIKYYLNFTEKESAYELHTEQRWRALLHEMSDALKKMVSIYGSTNNWNYSAFTFEPDIEKHKDGICGGRYAREVKAQFFPFKDGT